MKLIKIWPTAFAAGLLFAGNGFADSSLIPKPAQIMPKAVQAILNDVVKVGDAFVAVGDRGHVLRSRDAKTWTQMATPVQAMLNRVRFLDEGAGWAVGHDATILQTSDGGKTWNSIHSDTQWGKPFYDILFLDQERGFVTGANGVLKSTQDGGQNWELLEPDFTMHGLHLNSILQLADGSLVIGGEKGLMARSADAGETWEQVQTPYAGSFFGMLPYGEQGVFVFGLRGNVYSAQAVMDLPVQDSMEWDEFSLETITDSAQLAETGWHYYPNTLKESLFGGTPLGAKDVLLVGVNGAVVRTAQGRMSTVSTSLEHTLGSALLLGQDLITVGLAGVQTIAFERR